MLTLLIFQSDIMGFSTPSNVDCACAIVPLEMTLKLYTQSASLINIMIIKTTSNSNMCMTMCHGSYINQTNNKEQKIIVMKKWMKKAPHFEREQL